MQEGAAILEQRLCLLGLSVQGIAVEHGRRHAGAPGPFVPRRYP
jgi:hypothetical protein